MHPSGRSASSLFASVASVALLVSPLACQQSCAASPPVLRLRCELQDSSADAAQRSSHRAEAKRVLEKRLGGLGVRGASVVVRGERIDIELPRLDVDKMQGVKGVISRVGKLELKRVDDTDDVIGRRMAGTKAPPDGIEIEVEMLPAGGRENHYAVARRRELDAAHSALVRLKSFVATIPASADREMGYAPVLESGGASNRPVQAGWRTYWLYSRAEIGNEHIQDALARTDSPYGWMLDITFTTDGARRFEELTASSVKKRIAIVVDGKVQSAPVVQSAIPGGRATITLGAGSMDEQESEARQLEAAFRSGSLPAPLVVMVEEAIR